MKRAVGASGAGRILYAARCGFEGGVAYLALLSNTWAAHHHRREQHRGTEGDGQASPTTVKTSVEIGTTWLAVALSAEARKKSLGRVCGS
jgi:hypothetical protein